MSTTGKPAMGTILWHDLTVADAEGVRDFYAAVVGWEPEPVAMGEYADFSMKSPESGEGVAGVCHARGENADLPAQWLTYVAVPDLEASMKRCTEVGGRLLTGVKGGGDWRYCVIQDPAGAVLGLMQVGEA